MGIGERLTWFYKSEDTKIYTQKTVTPPWFLLLHSSHPIVIHSCREPISSAPVYPEKKYMYVSLFLFPSYVKNSAVLTYFSHLHILFHLIVSIFWKIALHGFRDLFYSFLKMHSTPLCKYTIVLFNRSAIIGYLLIGFFPIVCN